MLPTCSFKHFLPGNEVLLVSCKALTGVICLYPHDPTWIIDDPQAQESQALFARCAVPEPFVN